jgi:biotin transporter BioY
MDLRTPTIIVLAAILLGFYLNYSRGMTWQENVENMSSWEKVLTYLGAYIVLLLWKNRKKINP